MTLEGINPLLVVIVAGFGCGLVVLRESPKAAHSFTRWLLSHQAGKEAYRAARQEFIEKHRTEEETGVAQVWKTAKF